MAESTETLSLITNALGDLSRQELGTLTEFLVDHLDGLDGDPDLEPEEDRCTAGDDGLAPFYYWGIHHGSHEDELGI